MPKKIIQNRCKYCKKDYVGYGKIYCSKSCRAKDTGVGNGIKTGKWVKCKICKKLIWRKRYLLQKFIVFYCSKKCLGFDNAVRIQEKYRDKPRFWLIGKNNHEWKGNRVGYSGLHSWVYKVLGKPKKCMKCGSIKNIDWANKSNLYKRDKNDWISLCRSHHFLYDNNFKNL